MKKEIYVKEIIVHQSWSRAKVGNVVNEGFNVQKYNQLNYSYDKVEGELGGRGELGEEG